MENSPQSKILIPALAKLHRIRDRQDKQIVLEASKAITVVVSGFKTFPNDKY